MPIFQDLKNGLAEVDAFLAGDTKGYKVTVPVDVDVKAIRKRLVMTQSRFSDTFGFSLDAVKHWEGGRRTPESSARAYLTVIDRNPDAVISALQPAPASDSLLSPSRRVSPSRRAAARTASRSKPKVHSSGRQGAGKTTAVKTIAGR